MTELTKMQQVCLKRDLTMRETEIVELVAKGMTNKEVANTIFRTEKTVKFHLNNVFKKLELKSRYQLAAWYNNLLVVNK